LKKIILFSILILFFVNFTLLSAPSNLSLQGIVDWIPTGIASMSFASGITLGTGTSDAFITRSATGTVKIASYTVIPSETATPTGTIATGTFWNDGNQSPPKIKVYNGATWNDLW